MDPATVGALISGGVQLLLTLVSFFVYHKFVLPGSAPVTPATDPTAVPTTGHPVLDMIVSTLSDILKTHATSAIKGGIGAMVAPALLQAAKQFLSSLEAGTGTPAVAMPKAA